MKTDLELVKDYCISWRNKAIDLRIIADRDGNLDALGYFDGTSRALGGVIEYVESIERINALIGL